MLLPIVECKTLGFDVSHRSIVLMGLLRSVAHSVLVKLTLNRKSLKSHSDILVSILIA